MEFLAKQFLQKDYLEAFIFQTLKQFIIAVVIVAAVVLTITVTVSASLLS